jgi:hypothetical protein
VKNIHVNLGYLKYLKNENNHTPTVVSRTFYSEQPAQKKYKNEPRPEKQEH